MVDAVKTLSSGLGKSEKSADRKRSLVIHSQGEESGGVGWRTRRD